MPANWKDDYSRYETWLCLKSSQFSRLGYPSINEQDIWEYLTSFKWKHQKDLRYHQAVRQIMSMQPNDYFNYASLDAQVHSPASLGDIDLNGLI